MLNLIVTSLSRASTAQVHVLYSTTDWEATSAGYQQDGTAGDYAYTNSDVTFEPGETQKTVTVQTHPDDTAEGTELMTLDLVHVEGAEGTGAYGTGRITDN